MTRLLSMVFVAFILMSISFAEATSTNTKRYQLCMVTTLIDEMNDEKTGGLICQSRSEPRKQVIFQCLEDGSKTVSFVNEAALSFDQRIDVEWRFDKGTLYQSRWANVGSDPTSIGDPNFDFAIFINEMRNAQVFYFRYEGKLAKIPLHGAQGAITDFEYRCKNLQIK